MKSLRKVMGVGSYTTSGMGVTSYCLSDGVEECVIADYHLVEGNLVKEYGEPIVTDTCGARYWYKEGIGVIILPLWKGTRFCYVDVDKGGTMEWLEKQVVRWNESPITIPIV